MVVKVDRAMGEYLEQRQNRLWCILDNRHAQPVARQLVACDPRGAQQNVRSAQLIISLSCSLQLHQSEGETCTRCV